MIPSDLNDLKLENKKLKDRILFMENNLDRLLKEKESTVRDALETNQNKLLTERDAASTLETMTEAMDELAHAINTSIMVATNSIKELPNSPERTKAFCHIKQIKNYTELVLWDLHIRKGELINFDADPVSVDLAVVIPEVIESIREEPSVLRPRNKARADQYRNMKVTPDISGNCSVSIPSEIQNVYALIILELMKNAFSATDNTNPIVLVSLAEQNENITLTIENNRIMDKQFIAWFKGASSDTSFEMPKSNKVGLRLILRWTKILQLNPDVIINEETNTTKIILNIPRMTKIAKS